MSPELSVVAVTDAATSAVLTMAVVAVAKGVVVLMRVMPVVFKSPVKSGFLSQNGLTITLTGFDQLYNRKKLHITAKNRLPSVSRGY